MTFTLTLSMVVFGTSLLLGWTAFLLGAIKWLLNRQINALETRTASAEKKSTETAAELSKHKQTTSETLASLELKFNQKLTCGNHQRMEANDDKLFGRLDSLHGDIRELVGGVKGLTNSLELINQHLLNGGK
jgi:hypothetical protein